MLQVGTIYAIRRMRHVQGWSERRISRELGVARNTVRAVLHGDNDGKYTLSKPRPKPVIGPHLDTIREHLKAEKEAGTWRKQRLTAARMYDLLEKDHGYTGSKSTVRRAVREIRLELGLPLREAFVPLVYEPAADSQADLFEADVNLRGETIRTSFLLLRSCYSTRPYVRRVPAENQESLFEALHDAFVYFDGVFHKVWFDNLPLAVDKILRSRARKVHDRFKAFRSHYAFETEFCAPAKGNEKGLVENGVGAARRNALTPVPEIDDWAELDEILHTWMAREDNRIPAGKNRTVAELWSEEKDRLIPLPHHAFDGARPEGRKVSTSSLVRYSNNYYSVPVALASAHVTVKVYSERVVIHCPDGTVVEHARLYGDGKTSFVLDHYLDLLHWKPRAFDRAAPVRAAKKEWPQEYEYFLRLLRSRLGELDGTRSFINVLELHRFHPSQRVAWAIRRSLTHEKPSYASVLAYLDVGRRSDEPRDSLSNEDLDGYPDAKVDDGDPDDYEQLRTDLT